MDKFLENFFKTHRMYEWRNSHAGQWAQLAEFVGDGNADTSKLNEKQRKWVKFLERTVPGDDNSPFSLDTAGWPKVKAYPAASDLKETQDWERLYQICQETWYEMKHNPDYVGYDMEVKQFISKYSYLFDGLGGAGTKVANKNTVDAINDLLTLLEKVSDTKTLNLIGIRSVEELKALRKDCTVTPPDVPKYNTNKEFREKIQKIANKVVEVIGAKSEDPTRKKLEDAVKKIPGYSGITNPLERYEGEKFLDIISEDYTGWHAPDFSANIATFKNDFPNLLKDIYDKSKVFEAFKEKEPAPHAITNAIEKSKKDIDYDNKESQNFIQAKVDAELTLVEQIQKWSGDTYEDYFKKYEGFAGGKKVGHPSEIETIIKIIDKEKIKPTDGLEKIIEKADDLQKKIKAKNSRAAESFKWFTDALKDFNTNPNMAPNMKGTLKSGAKMRKVIEQLIIRATESGKDEDIKHAEMAMDLLTIIQYGNTTSRILDILKEDDGLFNIFSNKDLSWNKNEGVKFITCAMDKTLRAAFFMVGRGAAFAYNKYRMHNKKFTDENISEELSETRKNAISKNVLGRTEAEKNFNDDVSGASDLAKQRNAAKTTQANITYDFNKMGYTGSPEDILKAAETDVLNYKSDEQLQQNKVDQYTRLLDQLEKAKTIYQALDDLNSKKANIIADTTISPEEKTADITTIKKKIDETQQKLIDEIGDKGKLFIISGTVDLSDTKKYNVATIDWLYKLISKDKTYKKAQKDLINTQNKIYDRQSRINEFREATEDLKYAEELIKEREKTFKEWDKKHYDLALHLEQYWNALQAQGMTNMGLFSKRVENGQLSIANTISRMGTGLSY